MHAARLGVQLMDGAGKPEWRKPARNRIRFEMRREVKRARKQRRADLKQAKRDWAEGRFDKVPGETEFIPLPDQPKTVSYP